MTTVKLTEKQRDDLKSLLEDHQKVSDALSQVGKPHYSRILTVSHETDGQDFYEVHLNHNYARAVLVEQKAWIEVQLKKLGIVV